MNKKADKILTEQIIFIILVIVFLIIMIGFVVRTGDKSSNYEQIYAKQIALAIDKAKPETGIILDVSDLHKIALKNKFNGKIIDINNEKNKIIVRLSEKGGYEYNFLNRNKIIWEFKKNESKLYLTIKNAE